MRRLAQSLPPEKFKKQVGPFALVQRPPTDQGPSTQHTAMARPEDIARSAMGLLFEFEELVVATLPPLSDEDSLSVGRLPDNDLVLDHPSVSKRHASLTWNDDKQRCTVTDLGSTNGTFLNDANLGQRATALRDGDIVSFGDVQFWFLLTDTFFQKLGAKSGAYKLGSRSG
jgi:hypothetical protein